MAAIDEIVDLEQYIKECRQSIVTARSNINTLEAKLEKAEAKLKKAQENQAFFESACKELKAQDIVNLYDWGQARELALDNADLVLIAQEDVFVIKQKIDSYAKKIPRLEAEIKATEETLSKYGIVYEFKK